jgi:hypothetical protein
MFFSHDTVKRKVLLINNQLFANKCWLRNEERNASGTSISKPSIAAESALP